MSTQIYRSTLSDRKFASFTTIVSKSKSKWIILLASMVFHFALPGIILSYGVILIIRVNDGLEAWKGMITPSLFYISWTMADPWFRDAKESWGSNIDIRLLSAGGVFLAFSGVATASIFTSSITDSICIGLFGGLGTSLVLSQIDFVLADAFETNLSRVKCLCKTGQAFGQCVMPYIVLPIFDYYGYMTGLLVVSCIIIQVFPLIFLIKPDRPTQPRKMTRLGSYQKSISLFNDNYTDTNFTSIDSSNNNIPMVDLAPKTWRSPSDENIAKEFDNQDDNTSETEDNVEIISEVVPDARIKHVCGFDILPQIVEESETSESENDENIIYVPITSSSSAPDKSRDVSDRRHVNDDIKRLSVISDKLDEIIQSADHLDIFKDEKQVVENELDHIVSSNTEQNNTHFNQNINWSKNTRNISIPKRNSRICGCCSSSSYKFHRLKRNTCNSFDNFVEFVVDPFILSIKTWQFYPALLLKLCSLSIPFNVSCLVSLLIIDTLPNKSFNEIAYFTTIHGTGWLCSLIALPCVISHLSKSKFKYFCAFGMIVASVGMFALINASKIEFIALSSATIGFGYGFISTTYEDTLRETIGLRKWTKLRGTIDCGAGICLGIITSSICFKLSTNNDIEFCFGLFTCLLFFSGLSLVTIPLAMAIRKYLSSDQPWPHLYE